MPEISVIVPVYDVEKYLDRCLESLRRQTLRDFEVILVDDGSPDLSPQLCDDWAARDPRFRVIHKENGGLSSARNAGLDAARGRFIAFLDSDDWVEPDMLAYLHGLLERYPTAQIAQCGTVVSRAAGAAVSQPAERVLVRRGTELLDYFFRVDGEASNDGVWNRLYRRELMEGFRFRDTRNEDVEATYELFDRAGEVVFSNRRLHHYFVNRGGITRSGFTARDLDYLAVWDRVVERTAREHPAYLPYAEIGRKRADLTLLSKMLLQGYDRGDAELRAVRRELKRAVRRDFRDLMRWKMPLSRKVLLVIVCL